MLLLLARNSIILLFFFTNVTVTRSESIASCASTRVTPSSKQVKTCTPTLVRTFALCLSVLFCTSNADFFAFLLEQPMILPKSEESVIES